MSKETQFTYEVEHTWDSVNAPKRYLKVYFAKDLTRAEARSKKGIDIQARRGFVCIPYENFNACSEEYIDVIQKCVIGTKLINPLAEDILGFFRGLPTSSLKWINFNEQELLQLIEAAKETNGIIQPDRNEVLRVPKKINNLLIQNQKNAKK